MTYVIVYFEFPGMTTTWDNFSLLYVGESQSISEAYNSGLQTQLHKVQTVWMAEKNTLRLFIFKKILCSSRTAQFLRWRKLGCRFKSRQWGSVHFFCFRFSFFHRMFTLCLVSVLTADPFLASRDFCDNVFVDYLSLFIHNIGPKYDRETKLISNLISWKLLWNNP